MSIQTFAIAATFPCHDCGEWPDTTGLVFHQAGCSLEALGHVPLNLSPVYVQPTIDGSPAPIPASGRARPPGSPARTSNGPKRSPAGTCTFCGAVDRDAEGRYVHTPTCRITTRAARRAA